jgi:hypothetical protein
MAATGMHSPAIRLLLSRVLSSKDEECRGQVLHFIARLPATA